MEYPRWLILLRPRPHFEADPGPSTPVRALVSEEEHCELHALCDACTRVFQRSRLIRGSSLPLVPATELHDHHSSFQALLQAVQERCHFCTMISDGSGLVPSWPRVNIATIHSVACKEKLLPY